MDKDIIKYSLEEIFYFLLLLLIVLSAIQFLGKITWREKSENLGLLKNKLFE